MIFFTFWQYSNCAHARTLFSLLVLLSRVFLFVANSFASLVPRFTLVCGRAVLGLVAVPLVFSFPSDSFDRGGSFCYNILSFKQLSLFSGKMSAVAEKDLGNEAYKKKVGNLFDSLLILCLTGFSEKLTQCFVIESMILRLFLKKFSIPGLCHRTRPL